MDQHLTPWILDYLTNRPQYVRTQDYVGHNNLQYKGPTGDYRELIRDFVDWCQQKTKELVVDLHRYKQPCTQVNIQGADILQVPSEFT